MFLYLFLKRTQWTVPSFIAVSYTHLDVYKRQGYDRHVHKFIRTAIDMDKNRVFSQDVYKRQFLYRKPFRQRLFAR